MTTISGIGGADRPQQNVSIKPQGAAATGTASESANVDVTPAEAMAEVFISPQADIAAAILEGASDAMDPEKDPTVQRLGQAVEAGRYHRPAVGIAKAMLAFERRLPRGVHGG